MSQELIKAIRKNPSLFDEYRRLLEAQILDYQEFLKSKAAR